MIVGLGNPGPHYRDSRHNLGFRVVEALADELAASALPDECGAELLHSAELLLVRPLTYMNRSGWAVRCLVDRHEIAAERCLIVYDDVALPLGRLRLRAQGGPGGHRGMESIIAALQTESVARLRLGIRPPDPGPGGAALSDFVLAPFAPAEVEPVERMVMQAAAAARVWSEQGIEAAMIRIHGHGLAPDPTVG